MLSITDGLPSFIPGVTITPGGSGIGSIAIDSDVFTGGIIFNFNSADDNYSVASSGSNLGITVNGGGGDDTITMDGSDDVFNPLGAYSGNVNDLIAFNNVEVMAGGDGDDTFYFFPGGFVDSIDGGEGNDTISFGVPSSSLLARIVDPPDDDPVPGVSSLTVAEDPWRSRK